MCLIDWNLVLVCKKHINILKNVGMFGIAHLHVGLLGEFLLAINGGLNALLRVVAKIIAPAKG